MSRFKIQNKEDNSIIEIVAMNIDNENNVLIKENNSVSTISLNDFKDMVLGELQLVKKQLILFWISVQ